MPQFVLPPLLPPMPPPPTLPVLDTQRACPKCKQTSHKTSNSLKCPYNRRFSRAGKGTGKGAGKGAGKGKGKGTGRGRGRVQGGRARSNAASNEPVTFCFKEEVDEYNLIFEDESIEEMLDGRFKEHIEMLHTNTIESVKTVCGDTHNDSGPLPLFLTLAEESLNLLTQWMQKAARKQGFSEIHPWEVHRMLAIIMFSDSINHGLDHCIDLLESAFQKKFKEQLVHPISLNRFKELFKCVRGSNPSKQMAGQLSWTSTIDTVPFFSEFETKSFEPIRRMLLTSKACLVIDDELVGSRSRSVQSKAISDRKANKEGIKNDAVGCALTRVLVAVKHRKRLEYSQHETVEELILLLSKYPSTEGMLFAADRGYGCIRLWRYLASVDMGFVMISNSFKSQGHPFVNQSTINEQEARLAKKFEMSDQGEQGTIKVPFVFFM